MGKADPTSDAKKAEKKAKKRAKKEAKEAKKEAKRLKKEQKRRDREAQIQPAESESVTPSPKAAASHAKSDQLLEDAVFCTKRIEVSISLLPVAMGNIKAALEDSIRAMILKYTDKVGVLLTFHNVKIISNSGHGIILNELPHLHYKVGFDGLVFTPRVGCKVRS